MQVRMERETVLLPGLPSHNGIDRCSLREQNPGDMTSDEAGGSGHHDSLIF